MLAVTPPGHKYKKSNLRVFLNLIILKLKMKKRGRGGIVFLIILLILLGAALYFLILTLIDLRAESVQFIMQKPASEEQLSFSSSPQFYPNMRFADSSLKYNIDTSCNQEKIKNVQEAITELEQKTSLLKFSASGKAESQIFFSCSKSEQIYIPGDYFIAGEGGPTSIINASLFYIINEGKVLLFYEKSQCRNYNVELHEMLHVFGFRHSDNKESIMYNTTFCNQVLTNDIVKDLKTLYSITPLPDLYFSDISAEKQGHYINFNVTIKNQGLKEAESVSLELYSENKKIDEFDFKTIKSGEGRILIVRDITIPRKTEKIKFVVVAGNELDKDNNEIFFYLPQ